VFALAAWWPKTIHEGSGVARWYVDTLATQDPVPSIDERGSRTNAGGVFETFAETFRKNFPSTRTETEFTFDGRHRGFKVDGVGEVHSEPIRNPITREEFCGQIHLPNGIPSMPTEVTNIARWSMKDEERVARHENRAGLVRVLEMDPTGCVG
jgi:hypothetical protein